MEQQLNLVSLENVAQGAAVELFNDELRKTIENILDVNTDAKTTREITLKVKIKPDEDRTAGSVTLQAISKLAPTKPVGTVFFMGRRAGNAIATERNTKQLAFDDKNVVELTKGASG